MEQKRVTARMSHKLWGAFYTALRAQGMTFNGWLRKEAAEFVNKHKEQ